MGKMVKIVLVVALLFILTGGIVFGGVLVAQKRAVNNYQKQELQIDEEFSGMEVVAACSDIAFVPSQNGKVTVSYYEREKVEIAVSVQDGKLTVRELDGRKWYERFFGFDVYASKIIVALPLAEYGALQVKAMTGDIEISEGLAFESVAVTVTTGEVDCDASVFGDLTITATTGDISLEHASVSGGVSLSVSTGKVSVEDCAFGDFTLTVSTGRAELEKVSCKNFLSKGSTGNILLEGVIAKESFSIERTTGNVRFDGCDAADIFVKTSTGNITGTLLSSKVFSAKATTGKVTVPDTKEGGRCELNATTGDIRVSIIK